MRGGWLGWWGHEFRDGLWMTAALIYERACTLTSRLRRVNTSGNPPPPFSCLSTFFAKSPSSQEITLISGIWWWPAPRWFPHDVGAQLEQTPSLGNQWIQHFSFFLSKTTSSHPLNSRKINFFYLKFHLFPLQSFDIAHRRIGEYTFQMWWLRPLNFFCNTTYSVGLHL